MSLWGTNKIQTTTLWFWPQVYGYPKMHLVKHHGHLKSPWPLNSSNSFQKSKFSSENQSKFGVVLWKIRERITCNTHWHTVKMSSKIKAHQRILCCVWPWGQLVPVRLGTLTLQTLTHGLLSQTDHSSCLLSLPTLPAPSTGTLETCHTALLRKETQALYSSSLTKPSS